MTREELKAHCERQIESCEMWARHNGEEPHGKVYEEHKMILELLKKEPCEDAISRKSIKQKLQEHHDFFVNAYGGFSNLPQNDKSRVDEITNCIAMVVNEPPVTPQHTEEEYDKIIHLMNCAALQSIDTGRLDGKCEDVIPLEDAITIIDLVYKAERDGER